MIKIGVFGGSFDPIHRSRVRVIEESIRQLKLDKILVMPTANNPWKDSTGATKQQRLAMLEIALKRYKNVEICRYEIDQDSSKKNYTIDTIRYLKKIYPNDQLYFMMGMHTFDSNFLKLLFSLNIIYSLLFNIVLCNSYISLCNFFIYFFRCFECWNNRS